MQRGAAHTPLPITATGYGDPRRRSPKCLHWDSGLLCSLKREHVGEHDLRRGGVSEEATP